MCTLPTRLSRCDGPFQHVYKRVILIRNFLRERRSLCRAHVPVQRWSHCEHLTFNTEAFSSDNLDFYATIFVLREWYIFGE